MTTLCVENRCELDLFFNSTSSLNNEIYEDGYFADVCTSSVDQKVLLCTMYGSQRWRASVYYYE